MGFDGQIGFDAAKKYPDNINQAIEYIERSTKIDSFSQKSAISNKSSKVNLIASNEKKKNISTPKDNVCYRESVADCPSLERIIDTMKFYQNCHDANDELLKYAEDCTAFTS